MTKLTLTDRGILVPSLPLEARGNLDKVSAAFGTYIRENVDQRLEQAPSV